ncbi:hypothetical protein ACFLQ6_01290, partial [Thermoproteota archaeon]
VVKVNLTDFTRVGSLTLNTGENRLASAVIDSANGYAYFGAYTDPGIVVKVNLTDFTRVGSLTLNTGENTLASAVIDSVNGYAYFGTWAAPGIVVKVNLTDFTRVGSLTLNTGEKLLLSAVIDSANGYAYFGTNTDPGIVVKVNLTNFTRVGNLTLNPGENSLQSAVIDSANGYAYFGTDTSPGIVVKVATKLVLTNFKDEVVEASENTVYFIYPDYQGVKPSGVSYAELSDWTATGFIMGMCSDMQIEVTDTNSTIVDTNTGMIKVNNSTIVLFGGPLVNSPVNYYEQNRTAPLYWGSVDSIYYWYAANGTRFDATAMPFTDIAAGNQDMFVVEAFTDNSGNNIFIAYGYGWKGTFAGGKFFKFIIYPEISNYTDSYYVFKWIDINDNSFVELNEIDTTPVISG